MHVEPAGEQQRHDDDGRLGGRGGARGERLLDDGRHLGQLDVDERLAHVKVRPELGHLREQRVDRRPARGVARPVRAAHEDRSQQRAVRPGARRARRLVRRWGLLHG